MIELEKYMSRFSLLGKDTDGEQNPSWVHWVPERSQPLLEAARLQLLVSQLERRPGVEHGGPQLGPNQVVAQPKDLRCKLGCSVRGEDGGAAQTCRGRGLSHKQDTQQEAGGKKKATLTTWHAQGRPDVLGPPVWSERRAVDDWVRRISRHDWAEAVTPARHRHKNSGHAIT